MRRRRKGGKREIKGQEKPKEEQKNVRLWNQICNGKYGNIRVTTNGLPFIRLLEEERRLMDDKHKSDSKGRQTGRYKLSLYVTKVVF